MQNISSFKKKLLVLDYSTNGKDTVFHLIKFWFQPGGNLRFHLK